MQILMVESFLMDHRYLGGPLYKFQNFKLDTVAHEVLGTRKDIEASGMEKVREIERRFAHDKESLAKYNLLDCKLVTDIFLKLELVELLLKRVEISGMLLDRIGASAAAFDHFYLPKIHRRGFVASNNARYKPGGASCWWTCY